MKAKSLLIMVGVCLVFATVASAQTVTGTLSGHVKDSTGALIPGAKIVAKDQQTGSMREGESNAEGFFQMSFLTLGSYEVTVSVQGFQTVRKTGVQIELNKTTVSDFEMKVATVTEVIEVTGETPQIETTVGELKHSVDAKTIESLPLAGRNFITLVEQIPGFQNAQWINSSNNPTNSTGSYAVFNGTGSRQTTFQIDGVNNDDSSENQNRQNVNVSSIREFQVLTNAFTAEFGRAGGAVILVQTKSGTNAFHGDLYDFIQNDIFNANSFFNNRSAIPKSKVRRNQYGWTVGGPIFTDRLFFFHSGERIANVGKSSIGRFTWLPTDGPRACNPGEVPAPRGPYCLVPAEHPNLQRDLEWMSSIMSLWNTEEMKRAIPDPIACATMIASGRPNRCVRVDALGSSFPDSDYSGKLDWKAPLNTHAALRYQYSRSLRNSPRIIVGDNFGTRNNRQYNLGLTLTHVFSNRQTGEFRYGFGNRSTIQQVTDSDQIPIIRFGGSTSTLCGAGTCGTVIGTSGNVPINRRQHDHQFVYNHTLVMNKHTWKAGIDQRFQLLNDIANNFHRGFWTYGSQQSTASILAGTGFATWENFLRGFVTSFSRGYGPTLAENRFGETNLYLQDDWRIRRNLTFNLGIRWEGVRAPNEIADRFSYGYTSDWDNIEPRFGFAYTPEAQNGLLHRLFGAPGNFVIRGGYGLYHSRVFQSIFSQTGASIRAQPPNGNQISFSLLCPFDVGDPSCGFVFTPGAGSSITAPPTTCSATGASFNGVRIACGKLLGSLLRVNPDLQMPYVQQWNLTIERQMPWKMALQLAYTGNRTIGNLFYDSINDSLFGLPSTSITVDVGGGNFQPVVFDRVCRDATDPICVGATSATSGPFRAFTALTSTTGTLASKGIVVQGGVPHGYISLSTFRLDERRPDATFQRHLFISNFGWTYYHGMVLKVSKRPSRGLSFTGSWTWSKAIDTGSEVTFTGVDINFPTAKQVNPARANRGLSSFNAAHRVVVTYAYELPWYRTQPGVHGRIFGGWNIGGTTTFQSGNPFTVTAGYDVNMDGLGGDRPGVVDPSVLFRSVDNGRGQSPCPTTVAAGVPCPDTVSQTQLPISAFFILDANGNRILNPGGDPSLGIGRNTFFGHGLNNFDWALWKAFRIQEGINLQLRMEWYNLFNRTSFNLPSSSTALSGTALGRITGQRNPFDYVDSGRGSGSRIGQFALRLTF